MNVEEAKRLDINFYIIGEEDDGIKMRCDIGAVRSDYFLHATALLWRTLRLNHSDEQILEIILDTVKNIIEYSEKNKVKH